MVDIKYDWPEFVSVFLLVFGFLIGLFSPSLFAGYFIIFLCGLIFGRLWVNRKRGKIPPLIFMSVAFLTGFILGAIGADARVIILLFLFGFGFSLWLHRSGFVKSVNV